MQPVRNATDLTDHDLRELYAYPRGREVPWLRLNFVASIDGAAVVDGTSGALSTPIDRRVFGVLRELADVVLVGAGTVRAENYGGVRLDEQARARRIAQGQEPTPTVAVVSTFGELDPESRLFADTEVDPILLTGPGLTGARMLDALAERGLLRVLCEGGPQLAGQLLADDVVDELCLTTAPLLTAGTERRIMVAAKAVRIPMQRHLTLLDDDGTALTRWVRAGGAE